MPDITDLLDQAAPEPGGAAPLDTIVRRGRRRRTATRVAAVGTPLAAVVVAAVVLTGGSPSGVTIDPPPMLDAPDEPAPEPTDDPADDDGTDAAPEPDETTPAPDGTANDGWVAPAGLGQDLLLLPGDEPTVTRLAAAGGADELTLDAGGPGEVGLFADGAGGIVWQPMAGDAGDAPLLHRRADGEVVTLLEADEGETMRLVGWDHDRDLPLVSLQRGSGIEDMQADLHVVPLTGEAPERIRESVGAWEVGLYDAAVTDGLAVYTQYVEAMENVVVDPPDRASTVVHEAGELTGEYLGGVTVVPERGLGVVAVGPNTPFDQQPAAALLLVDLRSPQVVDEIEVPLELGLADADVSGVLRVGDLSFGDGHVLVNRRAEAGWVAPLAYDLDTQEWQLFEHRDGGEVVGRAFLAAASAAPGDGATGQPVCATEDSRRNAPPQADQLALYLVCEASTASDEVYRLPVGFAATGDVEADLERLLDAALAPLADDTLVERGYLTPVAEAGQVELRSVMVDGGDAVVDLHFPDGAGNLTTSHLSNVFHHVLRGTVFQFDGIERLELREDGSCAAYGETFQVGECVSFSRDDAPWNG